MKEEISYGVGALITVTISIGAAMVAYSGGLIQYDFYNLPAWILGPLGVYTLVFSLVYREGFYNLAWSLVFLSITVISAMYKLVNVIMMVGILLIALGILSSFAYLRSRKKS